ncbi:MAG: hypothetical protein WCC87_18335 [Candidatus Korobacteraceae bacterium]
MSHISKDVNKDFVYDEYKNFGGWKEAVTAAERLLLRIELRKREVQAVVRLFRERMKAGEPWPGQVQESDRKRQANG